MYNREIEALQGIMDIKDYKRFNIRLYDIETGKFITKAKSHFLNNTLQLEFNSFVIITHHKNFNKETNILTINSHDFNYLYFLAEIQIKNYEFEELTSVDIPRLCIVPSMEFDLGSELKPMKITAEAIMLAEPSKQIFFNVNAD